MRVRMKLWLAEDNEVLYGQGRQLLLEALDETGSLAGAARKLKMSYRGAWGRMKASEERLGFKLAERSSEGRRAMVLTPEARVLMERFAKFRERADKFQEKVEKDLFADIGKKTQKRKRKK